MEGDVIPIPRLFSLELQMLYTQRHRSLILDEQMNDSRNLSKMDKKMSQTF